MRWLIPKGTVEEEGSGQPPWRNGARGGGSFPKGNEEERV